MVEGQLGHFGDAADVFLAVGGGEAEVAVQAVAHVVAVEIEGLAAQLEETPFERLGDRRFAGAREASEPQHGGLVAVALLALGAVDGGAFPDHVGRTGAHERLDLPAGRVVTASPAPLRVRIMPAATVLCE